MILYDRAALQVGTMIRISIAYFYNLGTILKPIAAVQGDAPVSQFWMDLFAAQSALKDFFSTEFFWPAIRASYGPGQTLLKAIETVTNKNVATDKIDHMEAYYITDALTKFETNINSELSIAAAYFVSRKGGYDTDTLIANAELIFPPDLGLKVPMAIPDVREAGRCLAYELSTAAGFHILRATEAVLRRYWEVVSNGMDHPSQRNMGVYIDKMTSNKFGDAKVIAVLTQIKDLHRNPLFHPEKTLALQEALGLFGIAQSAIGAMLKELPHANAVPGVSEVVEITAPSSAP
jgi:hypothetical protein